MRPISNGSLDGVEIRCPEVLLGNNLPANRQAQRAEHAVMWVRYRRELIGRWQNGHVLGESTAPVRRFRRDRFAVVRPKLRQSCVSPLWPGTRKTLLPHEHSKYTTETRHEGQRVG